jgi:type III secretory pathway component EscV
MVEFGLVVNMQIDEENSLNIFEMSVGINELTKEVVNELPMKEVMNKLQMFKKFQVDVKDTKHLLEWWAKHESLFLTMVFRAC